MDDYLNDEKEISSASNEVIRRDFFQADFLPRMKIAITCIYEPVK